MTRLVWVLAWIAVAVWSLVAFSAYGLIDLVGGLLARNADSLASDPSAVEWLFRILDGLKNIGLTAVLIVWGVVSLAMLAVPWGLSRLGRMQTAPQPRPDMQIVYPPGAEGRAIEMPRNEPPGRPFRR
jgi:hypothetical protein